MINVKWIKHAGLMRFPEAVQCAINLKTEWSERQKVEISQKWNEQCYTMSILQARNFAETLGIGKVYFDWDASRSREGYYRIQGGMDYSIMRGRAFAPYCDLLWMETSRPNLEQCRIFAAGIHSMFPHQMLSYNLSPSFNWDAAGMTDEDISTFQTQIGQLGYTWQFITLAGFHCNGLGITRFAREYAKKGIIAYVQMVQREERDEQVSTLTHQVWSGAKLADRHVSIITNGGTSTASLGAGDTEVQFTKSKL